MMIPEVALQYCRGNVLLWYQDSIQAATYVCRTTGFPGVQDFNVRIWRDSGPPNDQSACVGEDSDLSAGGQGSSPFRIFAPCSLVSGLRNSLNATVS